MPSKYGKEFAVPKEFPSVLKAFTREVLRSQPDNIYEFGAVYFTELVDQQNAAAHGGGSTRLSTEEIHDLLTNLFIQADEDGSGALSRNEFKKVLQSAELQLSDREVKRVLAEADTNGDGEVSYEEFIPIGVEIVHNIYAKNEMEAARAAEEDAAREEAQLYLVHGMTKEQVEAVMMDIFQKSDADGSGALSPAEFRKCCKDADIGLTRKEVNILMHSVDADGDGQISFEEFVPLCFEMLVEILKDEFLQDKRQPSDLEVFLVDMFRQADFSGEGVLDPIQMKKVLLECDFGLTKLQTHSILSQAEYDEDGFANYSKFAATAAELIYRMLDPESQMQKFEQVQALESAGTDFSMVHGLSADDVVIALGEAFNQFDPQGSGVMTMPDLKRALETCALQLSPTEVSSLMSAVEVDERGAYYAPLVDYAFYILQYLAQEAAAGY